MADSCGGTLPEGQMASTLARETNNNKDNEAGDPHKQVPNTCDDVIVGLSDVDFGSGSDQVDVNPTSSRGRKRSRSRTSDSDESDDRDSVQRDRYHRNVNGPIMTPLLQNHHLILTVLMTTPPALIKINPITIMVVTQIVMIRMTGPIVLTRLQSPQNTSGIYHQVNKNLLENISHSTLVNQW